MQKFQNHFIVIKSLMGTHTFMFKDDTGFKDWMSRSRMSKWAQQTTTIVCDGNHTNQSVFFYVWSCDREAVVDHSRHLVDRNLVFQEKKFRLIFPVGLRSSAVHIPWRQIQKVTMYPTFDVASHLPGLCMQNAISTAQIKDWLFTIQLMVRNEICFLCKNLQQHKLQEYKLKYFIMTQWWDAIFTFNVRQWSGS